MENKDHDRYAFNALPDRPAYDWPGSKRLAVSICHNIKT